MPDVPTIGRILRKTWSVSQSLYEEITGLHCLKIPYRITKKFHLGPKKIKKIDFRIKFFV